MKKHQRSITILITLILLLISTNVYAANVSITNVELEEKSENASINNDATYNGLEINTDIHFTLKDDYVKYKITIENKDDEEYKIETNSNDNSEYLEYSYENADIIPANSTKDIYMTITYTKLVSDSKYTNNNYTEEHEETFTLKNENNEIVETTVENPKTGSITNILTIIVTLLSIVLITILILIKKKTLFKYEASILAIAMLVSPLIVNSLETASLKINSKVEFDYLNDTFCFTNVYAYDESDTYREYDDVYIPYRKGMTYKDFFEYILENKREDYFKYGYEEYEYGKAYIINIGPVEFAKVYWEVNKTNVLNDETNLNSINDLLGETELNYYISTIRNLDETQAIQSSTKGCIWSYTRRLL